MGFSPGEVLRMRLRALQGEQTGPGPVAATAFDVTLTLGSGHYM